MTDPADLTARLAATSAELRARYGDDDPADAYDASDPLHVRLIVLARVAARLDDDPDPDRRARRRTDLARLLSNIVWVDLT